VETVRRHSGKTCPAGADAVETLMPRNFGIPRTAVDYWNGSAQEQDRDDRRLPMIVILGAVLAIVLAGIFIA
jgi:hypothetical protein